ncbi:MAG: hypothetical protein SFW66_06650 [Gammaproteobacteria bacterium]|nr:hypothetical protein [Gammaproteobacteria bacterium]
MSQLEDLLKAIRSNDAKETRYHALDITDTAYYELIAIGKTFGADELIEHLANKIVSDLELRQRSIGYNNISNSFNRTTTVGEEFNKEINRAIPSLNKMK